MKSSEQEIQRQSWRVAGEIPAGAKAKAEAKVGRDERQTTELGRAQRVAAEIAVAISAKARVKARGDELRVRELGRAQ